MRRCVIAAAVLLLTPACSAAQGESTVRVFAASSLTEVFSQAADDFQAAEGVRVEVSFAGSQTLLAQLAEGAQADVLATADEVSMARAVSDGLVRNPTIFATNRLVVVVPHDNPANIADVADIARPGVRLVLAGDAVPAGRYARDGLEQLGLDAALGNLVSEEEDVKGVIGKVVSAEADAGIVYATDVTPALRARVTALPLPVDVDIRYPISRTPHAGKSAQQFVAYLLDGDGADVLRAAGFGAP